MALAFETTGKYVSERHAAASAEGMITAGQLAAKMSRLFGEKITAKELKPYANEWHHSGFYKGNGGKIMGRTYFFRADQNLKTLYNSIMAVRREIVIGAAKPDIEKFSFDVAFKKTYTGRYGKKRWQPIAVFKIVVIKEGDLDHPISNEITKKEYDLLKKFDGEDLEPYETFSEFKLRILKGKK